MPVGAGAAPVSVSLQREQGAEPSGCHLRREGGKLGVTGKPSELIDLPLLTNLSL